MNSRDQDLILHIQRYCKEIDEAVQHFGDVESVFMSDAVYRNAVSMPVQQIGELCKHLSNDFIESYPEIPWSQIKGMRTWFAHQYLNMDKEIIWDVLHNGIPELKAFCDSLSSDNSI